MTDTSLIAFLLGVISLCLVVMTYAVVLTAADLRRVLRRLQAAVPHADHVMREAHRTLQQLNEVLARANEATARVTAVVHRACDRTAAVLDQLTQWKDHAGHFWKQHVGNGVNPAPRAEARGFGEPPFGDFASSPP